MRATTRMAIPVLAMAIGTAAAVSAQETETIAPNWGQRDRRDGLPHNAVFSILQDQQGFLWVGTNDGLARYDGRHFQVFRHRPGDSTSLANSTVRRLHEDRTGRLWIRTEVGLDRLERSTGRFLHFPLNAQQLLESADGALVVAAHDGLFLHDTISDRFARLHTFPVDRDAASPGPLDPVWGLAVATEGGFWVSTQRGFLFRLGADGSVARTRLPWRDAAVFREAEPGRLWIGHREGLSVFDVRSGASVDHAAFSTVRGPVITYRNQGEEVWFGGSGLYQSDVNGTVVRPVGIGGHPLSAPVWAVLKDREGLTWLGTPQGLRFLDPFAKHWLKVGRLDASRESVEPDAVMALVTDQSDGVLIGTLRGVRRAFDGTDPLRDGAEPDAPMTTACSPRVWAMLASGGRGAWIGSEDGLCHVSGGTTRRIRLPPGPQSENTPVIFALARDSIGGIWIGTSAGLYQLDSARGLATRLAGIGEERDGRVNVEGLMVDRSGILWAGTSRSDLYRIDPNAKSVRYFAIGDAAGLRGSEGFWAVAEVGDGRLWLGSDRGLYLFDPERETLDHVGASRGMPDQPVYAILRDDVGALWLSTGNGLIRHDNPSSATASSAIIRHFTVEDGLPFAEFNRRAAATGADGSLYFGGMGGVVKFHPAQFQDNPSPPRARVERLERMRTDGGPQVSEPAGDSIRLSSGDAGVILEFTAPSFSNPHRVRFAYRLDGVDPEWVPAGLERRVRYPRLRPGRYVFHVRAANADGVWGTDASPFALVVPPPWWQTWWFRLLAGSVIISSLVLGIRWVVARPLRRRLRTLELEQRLHRERERISRDLHDHVGAQVTTLLAGIDLSQLHAQHGALPEVQHTLHALREDTQRTMAQLRDTVWSLQRGAMSTGSLLGQIQQHLHERRRFVAHPALLVESSGDLGAAMPAEHALHLFRVAEEAVSNAIRHANATSVLVRIEVGPEPVLTLSIHDDGTFLEPPSVHAGSGLRSMQQRAEDIGGEFRVRRQPSGTTVVVEVPLKPAADLDTGRVAGVRA